jgi:hypothetical protein
VKFSSFSAYWARLAEGLSARTGEERLGYFGPLPVFSRGCPVACCLLMVLFFVAVPGCRCVLVPDGSVVVRVGCLLEGLDTGDKCLVRRGLGDGRMMLCLYQLIAGGCRVPIFPPGLLQVIDARADLGDTVTDLLVADLPAL